MFSLSASLANSLVSPGFSAPTSIELAGSELLLPEFHAMATLPRAAPSVSKVKYIPPILARNGATAVNSLWAGSSEDAMLLEKSEVSLSSLTAGFVHEDSGGGVDT